MGGGLTPVGPGGGSWLKAEAMLLCTALTHARCCPAESACSTQLLGGGGPQKGYGGLRGDPRVAIGLGGVPQKGYGGLGGIPEWL